MKMVYQLPVKLKKGQARTSVWLKGFEIKNKNSFHEGEERDSQLKIELTFQSNDYSTEKYTLFLDDFNKFLIENGWIEGKNY